MRRERARKRRDLRFPSFSQRPSPPARTCSFAAAFFSTARITTSLARTPTTLAPCGKWGRREDVGEKGVARAARIDDDDDARRARQPGPLPVAASKLTLRTASIAYSTCIRCPSGEKTVMERS
jgi:hypothetical protein